MYNVQYEIFCKYLIAEDWIPPLYPSVWRQGGTKRKKRNKASSTSDDPARAKRPILGCCWQTKKKTWKVLNCHSKMRPLDTEKDVQTKAQTSPSSISYPAFRSYIYIPRLSIDCTYILRSGRKVREKSAASQQYTYKCCPNNRANRESETERITPSARVSALTRPSAIWRL